MRLPANAALRPPSQSIDQFVRIVSAYARGRRLAEATVATGLLNDGKGIKRLRLGCDIGVRKVEEKVLWLSANWPDGASWPADVPRPAASKSKHRGKGVCHA